MATSNIEAHSYYYTAAIIGQIGETCYRWHGAISCESLLTSTAGGLGGSSAILQSLRTALTNASGLATSVDVMLVESKHRVRRVIGRVRSKSSNFFQSKPTLSYQKKKNKAPTSNKAHEKIATRIKSSVSEVSSLIGHSGRTANKFSCLVY